MSPPGEALQAVREAGEHLDAAHDLIAAARRGWDPEAPAGRCPCGPRELQWAHASVADAIRDLQALLEPAPGEREGANPTGGDL